MDGNPSHYLVHCNPGVRHFIRFGSWRLFLLFSEEHGMLQLPSRGLCIPDDTAAFQLYSPVVYHVDGEC